MVTASVSSRDDHTHPAPTGFGVQRRALDDRPHAYEVTVAGEIDSATAPRLEGELEAMAADGATFVVLDLRGVTFLDSSGLRAIVRAGRTLSERGGRLTCAGLSGAAARVLELTGLLDHLQEQAPRT